MISHTVDVNRLLVAFGGAGRRAEETFPKDPQNSKGNTLKRDQEFPEIFLWTPPWKQRPWVRSHSHSCFLFLWSSSDENGLDDYAAAPSYTMCIISST